MKHAATLSVNGMQYPVEVDGDATLLTVLRDDLGLTGTKTGCDDCECGACMVLLDGQPVNSCSYLAAQAQGRDITTVEGLVATDGSLHPLQRNILEEGGVQCGYCTPGMLAAAQDLLTRNKKPTREEIREHISGNYCRCTGYHAIVDAVCEVLEQRRQEVNA